MISCKKIKILCIIPARGGSKGLPGKNIKLMLGKPLVAWTIEQAKKSKYLTSVVVSTDSKEITEISRKYGAEVVERPKEFARDNSPASDAIMHLIDFFEKKGEFFDILIWLEPTSPLRKENDLDNAIEFFLKNIKKADSLVSVGEVRLENPYIMKKIKNGFVSPLFEVDKNFTRRQELPKAYFPYGVIYLVKTGTFKKTRTFYNKKTIPYIIERWQNYEIDDLYDFLCVEKIAGHIPDQKESMPENKKKNKLIKIQGGKIYLKEFSEDNLYDPRYIQWLRDIDVVKTIGRPEYLKPIPLLEVEKYVRGLFSSKNDYFFAIYLKGNDEFIGTLKIGSIDWYSKTADIGIMIGNKNYWGKGISKDAVAAACDYAFRKLKMRRLTGGCLSVNVAMGKCFERTGFKKEGVHRNQVPFESDYVDHSIYGMFKEEFYSQKN
jgi:CMP-N,N'-diacetyllegionaminic acid synthase